MYGFVAHAAPGQLLFRRWSQGLWLWNAVVVAVPGLVALVVMPDHIHLLHPLPVFDAFRHALGSFTQWRNALLETPGAVCWTLPIPMPELLVDKTKAHRSERYTALNPCRGRKRVVGDPLAWPLSSHRDACGLALQPVRRPVADPARYHRWISGDPAVAVEGTPLPTPDTSGATPEKIVAAVSAITRTPLPRLRARGAPRNLLVRSLRALTQVPDVQIAELAGTTSRTIRNHPRRIDHEVLLVQRVLGDARFPALHDRDLPTEWSAHPNHGYR